MQGNNESLHRGVSHKPGNLTFEKISQLIRRNRRPKKRLVMVERTKFMLMKQEIDKPIIKYLHHLQSASRYREFEKLRQEQMIEEDLIQSRLIEGIYNVSHQYKIMEHLQIRNMSLNTYIDFIQQQELIQKYNHDKSQSSKQIFTNTYMLKKIKECSYCAHGHEIKWEKCPAFGKTCTNCLKKNNVQVVCKFKKKNVKS